jgi:hypothetical protein
VRSLRSFLLGVAAIGLPAYVAAAAIALSAQVGARDLDLAVGPVVLVVVAREGNETSTALGPGLAIVALAGGLANAVAASLLARRARSRADRLH